MSFVFWGRRRLIALVLFWGRSRQGANGRSDRGCAVLCPLARSADCPGEGSCTLTYRRHWSCSGRVLGATLLVYDADPMGPDLQEAPLDGGE